MHHKSKIWFYFNRINNNTVSCNSCNRHLNFSGNTSNLLKHSNSHNKSTSRDKKDAKSKRLRSPIEKRFVEHAFYNHGTEFENYDNATAGPNPGTSYKIEDEKLLPVQMNTSPVVGAIERISSYSDNEDADTHHDTQISDAILCFISIDNQPFSTIQYKGFKYLMKELAPLYKIPSEDVIKKKLDEKYEVMAQVFKQELSETSYVTITSYVWTETTSSNCYLRVTAHFIASRSKKLESCNIEVIQLPEYTERYIKSALLDALIKWNIAIDKVVAIVTKNEPDMVSAATQIFGQDKHIVCFAYTINQVMENSMKNCEGLGNIIDQVRKIVKIVKNKPNLSSKLHHHLIGADTPEIISEKLTLDIETRWNTTYHMIERFLESWDKIDEILYADNETLERPTAEELAMLKEILDLLRPLEFVAQECSAERYIAVSKVIPLINCTLNNYSKTMQTKQLSARLKEVILIELKKRFGRIEFVNLVSFATILDPRFKTLHFQNMQVLSDTMYLLRDMISKLPNASTFSESDTEQEETKYDLWLHHKLLARNLKEESDKVSLNNELPLYLSSSLASLKDIPLQKWESMKVLYPTLYKVAAKYLSIVATSVPADSLFSKAGVTNVRQRNQLTDERLHKMLFLNSVDPEYWF